MRWLYLLGNRSLAQVSLSHVTVSPPIYTLAMISNACIGTLSVMRDSVTDITPKAFTNMNELFDSVKLIISVLDEKYTENSLIEAPIGLKLVRRGNFEWRLIN